MKTTNNTYLVRRCKTCSNISSNLLDKLLTLTKKKRFRPFHVPFITSYIEISFCSILTSLAFLSSTCIRIFYKTHTKDLYMLNWFKKGI